MAKATTTTAVDTTTDTILIPTEVSSMLNDLYVECPWRASEIERMIRMFHLGL